MTKEALKLALEALQVATTPLTKDRQEVLRAITAIKEALAQPEQKYHRGDRLICLETEEYCVIHISGTNRQWVKFPDSHIGVYTNEQVAELFELLPKEPEQEPVAWEQFYPDIGKPKFVAQPEQEPVAWISEDEREAFERFNETCEDGEGYDVPKTMMRRLAEIGVIHHTSRGIYGITKFGRLLVGNTTQPQRKPMTYEEIEDLYFKFSMSELKDLPETLKPHTELRSKT